eukprot:16263035-Heterocapsa_arctica.AAC.1
MDNYFVGKDDGKGIVHTRMQYLQFLNSKGRKPWTKVTRPDWLPPNELDEPAEKEEFDMKQKELEGGLNITYKQNKAALEMGIEG